MCSSWLGAKPWLAVKILSVVVVVVVPAAAAAATPVALARAQLFARTKPWLAVKILSLVGSFYTSDSGSTCTCAARLSLEKGPGAGSFAMHTTVPGAVVSTCFREQTSTAAALAGRCTMWLARLLDAMSDAAADPPRWPVSVSVCPLFKQVVDRAVPFLFLYRAARGQDVVKTWSRPSKSRPSALHGVCFQELQERTTRQHKKRREGGGLVRF